MSDSSHDSDPKNQPVVWSPPPTVDIVHHQKEWSSGTRGGGHVPKSFTWPTNPKEHQEENGSGALEAPVST